MAHNERVITVIANPRTISRWISCLLPDASYRLPCRSSSSLHIQHVAHPGSAPSPAWGGYGLWIELDAASWKGWPAAPVVRDTFPVMASRAAVLRLQKEYKALLQEPPHGVEAHPSPNNILQWNYVLRGPVGSEFEAGIYHGQVDFPPEFPWKPPEIKMLTPSGRFAPNKALCLSMSNYHPETWNPLWSVSTILTGVLSFMLEDSIAAGTVRSSKAERRRLAKQSLAYNCRNRMFCHLFPDYVEQLAHQQIQQQAAGHADGGSADKDTSGIFWHWAVRLAMAGAIVSLAIPLYLHLQPAKNA